MRSILIIISILSLLTNISIATETNDTQTRLLNSTEINQQLQNLPGWTTNGKQLSRTFQFKNFVEAIDFVNLLVEPAQTARHHPDISISYHRVTISLTTHDAGGLTQQDFALAKKISQLAQTE
ncbi:MAG: 4a-hydroxytetrahydrobiopterin dehydratase [Symploca sp. SIO3C6]|uniref:Putative pterin-4-alpha-carbinolamine dehydratase n=1 Tax=Symploca sp. SIO1C4 TaxID=2607765 RepID=A0A6B3NP10_9CYAN|nr:4a-hydroxytetrahydrobiopterin dehydratase [Symploca sp. SIO3C6]NER30968.1 4a-hydroxytetrahydrobiopterin dehydratase [Symploca sp. SIO1C4]